MSRILPCALVAFATLFGGVACRGIGPAEITEPQFLGGEWVSVERLNRGRTHYHLYCQSCHGAKGDGLGPLGFHQVPRPRDLRLGIIKFASVASGSLPTDADLSRVIRRGVPGTAMLAWKVPEAEIDPVIQYIKTFSPRWRREGAGAAIEISDDPWGGDPIGAIARGRGLYHGVAKCTSCHAAYVDLATASGYANAAGLTAELRADVDAPTMSDSAYGPLRATDFGRSGGARLRGGDSVRDFYRAIAAGVGGTAMPTWKGMLPEADLWALARYVHSLTTRTMSATDAPQM